MKLLTISEPAEPIVQTTGAEKQVLGSNPEFQHREDWQMILDRELLEWGARPDQFADEDSIAPTRKAVATAYQIATQMRDAAAPPPMWVTPTTEGGVAFARRDSTLTIRLVVRPDGSAELIVLKESRIESRDELSVD